MRIRKICALVRYTKISTKGIALITIQHLHKHDISTTINQDQSNRVSECPRKQDEMQKPKQAQGTATCEPPSWPTMNLN